VRQARQFSAAEWLRLDPLTQGLKQLHNDALLARYLRQPAPELAAFLQAHSHLRGQSVALVIAFEQTWTLDWLLEQTGRNLPAGATVLVFDNSRTPAARLGIASVCNRYAAPYLPLPPYRTRHVNRSHGMAMTWVFHNVVRALQPRLFAYLDHDLVPVTPADPARWLDDQAVYGLINEGRFGCWSLWAGYCAFRFAAVADRPLNFLYDFSRSLDTGGRNWPALYSHLPRARLRFAAQEFLPLRLPGGEALRCELVDGAWVHVGGVGYNDNSSRKIEAFTALRQALGRGASLRDLVDGAADPSATAG
jgi:hypothetical protein